MAAKKTDWQEIFLRCLSEHGNVKRACQEAGIGRTLAYATKEAEAEFDLKWLNALDDFADDLESEATRRDHDAEVAQNGDRLRRPSGLQRHDIRSYSDSLLLAQLKALRPELYRESYDLKEWVRAAMDVANRTKPWKPE